MLSLGEREDEECHSKLCGISWSYLNPYVSCMNMIYSLEIVCTSFRPGIG